MITPLYIWGKKVFLCIRTYPARGQKSRNQVETRTENNALMQTFPQLLICKEIMLLIRLQNLLEAILNTFRYMFIVRALCHVLDF